MNAVRLVSCPGVPRCSFCNEFEDWSWCCGHNQETDLGDRRPMLVGRDVFLRTAAMAAATGLVRPPAGLAAAAAGTTEFQRVQPIQFIAANIDPNTGGAQASSGTAADTWGIWRLDPGPRGVMLKDYGRLEKNGGVAREGWRFDKDNWWLEEHGLIMEAPDFPLPPGKYLVTGGREVTTELTIAPDYKWTLGVPRGTRSDVPARLVDVTHLPCRAARYSGSSPASARQQDFPVKPGAEMPAVQGSQKKDYSVLFVVGIARDASKSEL